MKRTPLYDNFSEQDDRDNPSNVRPVPTPSTVRTPPRSDVRYLRGSRRPPPRRASRWRSWIISGALGVAILSGVWLGLLLAFPPFERSSVQPAATAAPEPPRAIVPDAGPAATAAAEPPVAAQSQPTATGAERLPGIATASAPAGGTVTGQTVAAPKPTEEQTQAAEKPADAQQQTAGATRPVEGALPPGQAAEKPADAQQAANASQPVDAPAESRPTAEASQPDGESSERAPESEQPRAEGERPAEAQPGPVTPAPIPPQDAPVRAAAPAPKPEAPRAAAPAPTAPPAARQQPAQKPAAAAPPPPASGGAFALSASVSPANPVSENAVVTVSVRATSNGAPVAGASCIATIHYRTASARQPAGGFSTGANGVGSFVLDAKGTTYGYAVPIDVTCTGRGGSASARTSFTPVRGR